MGTAYLATVAGGFFAQFGTTIADVSAWGNHRKRAARSLGRQSTFDLRARMTALDGVAAGSNATKNFSRVVASSELGGVRAIETIALVNRNTTAADVTEIEKDINSFSTRTTFGASPPANLDGNPLGTR